MKFKELINYLDEQFPRILSVTGDNDGIDVCVDYNLETGRILLVLDVTFEAINYAIQNKYNCILAHHPMIAEPLTKLDFSSSAAKKAVMLASNNICSASFHTRLDSVQGGVNDCLLNAVGIAENVEFLSDPVTNTPIGRIVTLNDEVNLHDFAIDIKKSLRKFFRKEFSFDAEFNVNYISGGKKVKKIGVVGGSGMFFVESAAKMGIDTYFTGEGKYHSVLEAHESFGINIITAGHFETEVVVLPFIKQKVHERFPDAEVDYFVGEIIDV